MVEVPGGIGQLAGAVLALTSREEVAEVLRTAAQIVEGWSEDNVSFIPLHAIHWVRPEFVHRLETANLMTDWNILLQSASMVVAYLAWGEAFEFNTLLDPGVPQHVDSFLLLADWVENPGSAFGH